MDDLDLDTPPDAGSDDGTAGGGSGSGPGVDLGIIIGLVMGFGSLLAGMLIEGSAPMAYVKTSAFIIVVGGTMGATLTSVGMSTFKGLPAGFKRSLKYQNKDRVSAIKTLVAFAERARREGLLVLEDDLARTDDQFLKKGVQLVVDGTDPELVKEILQTEVDSLAEENERNANVWTVLGGYSPTLGIIGTVMGLVLVLSNLKDAQSLGPAIAVAFVATFYGVCLANLVYLPIGMKLLACSQDEISARELMIEGILAIQSGDNPRIVEEKLVAFLDVRSKKTFRAEQEGDGFEMDLAA
jgi:chemotaxis protein MotA